MRRVENISDWRRGGSALVAVLVAVVVIIILLAALLVPGHPSVQETMKKIAASMVDRDGELPTQIRLFQTAVGRWPTGLEELVEKPKDEKEAAKWRGPYVESLDKLKDPWGSELKYRCPGKVNTDTYDLWSMGPDQQDGTDDDITNWVKQR